MKIIDIHTKNAGPLENGNIQLNNDWTETSENKVLFTGPNGCGKSTLLRLIAMFWEATAYWLDNHKILPQRHEARIYLQQWAGVAVVVDGIEPFHDQPVAFVFGSLTWISALREKYHGVVFIGESIVQRNQPVHPKRALLMPKEEWISAWGNNRKKMTLSYDHVDCPNMIYLDAEERRWVKPKRNLSEPQPVIS